MVILSYSFVNQDVMSLFQFTLNKPVFIPNKLAV